MYTASYFPAEYFPRAYFPRPAAEKVKYFYHGAFPSQYFTDSYFPGEFVTVVIVPPEPPPTPTFVGGGAPVRQHIPSVTAVWDLELPVPVVDALGYVTEIIRGTQDLPLPRPSVQASGSMQPANMVAQWSLTLPRLTFDVQTTIQPPQRKSRRPSDDDELDAFYMASVAWYRGED